jgi:hypothetical protein
MKSSSKIQYELWYNMILSLTTSSHPYNPHIKVSFKKKEQQYPISKSSLYVFNPDSKTIDVHSIFQGLGGGKRK